MNETASAGRSSRARKKAVYDEDAAFGEELVQQLEEVVEREEPLIDKLLARRKGKNEGECEYLVKWRERSYLHVEWLSAEEIAMDADGEKRIRRFDK